MSTPRRLQVHSTLLLLLLLGLPAWACLNHYGKMNVHGETIPMGDRKENYSHFIGRLRDHREHDAIVAAPAPAEPAPDADFKVRTDYSVALVHRAQSRKHT